MSRRIRYVAVVAAITFTLGILGCTPADTPDGPADGPAQEGAYPVATTEDVQSALADGSTVVVDARENSAFIGWPLDGVARGGHIEGAVDFSAAWLTIEGEDAEGQEAIEQQLDDALANKGLDDATSVIVYDVGGSDATAVADHLAESGIEDIMLYDVTEWADDSALPMVAYPNYELIVPASYVKDAIENPGAEDVKVFECSWGEESDEYREAHIPGAVHIDTDEVEFPPVWNRKADADLEAFALANGITAGTKVILYGADPMAAYRVHAILTYLGVDDVRTLNGGFAAWTRAGYETESGSNPKVAVGEFGVTVPARPGYIVDMPEAKEALADPEGSSLVDIRSWEEHIGETPGYSDIDEAGRPAGARYGGDNPADFRNVDGTMRNFDEVLAMWAEWGIMPDQRLLFFCGTGWRAAEVLVLADVAGLDSVALYDGGWYEWIMVGDNPIQTGEPERP